MARNKINTFVDNYELNNYSGYTPNPELIEFIMSNTNKSYSFSLWTNNSPKIVQKFLLNEKLNDRFTKIVDHNSVSQLKPESEGFSLIYIPNTPLSDYLLIGDSINDESAAKNAGIDFFKIDYFSNK